MTFSEPVHHPMEQPIYKYYVYILNDIDCIQLFFQHQYVYSSIDTGMAKDLGVPVLSVTLGILLLNLC